MEIIDVEEGLGMIVMQYSGDIKEFSPSKKKSLIENFIEIKEELISKFNISFQIFNSKYIISEDQIKLILHQVYSSFLQKTNISKQYSIEFLLYLSQERQITKAIEKVGIKIPNDKTNTSFGEILFGDPVNLRKALDFLENKINLSNHHQFKYLGPNKWIFFMETYNISIDQIINILKANNYKQNIEIRSLNDLQNNISPDLIRKALTDTFITGMVKLYIENFKRNMEN